MQVLFLSHSFPPELDGLKANELSDRTFEHCREWVAAGHRVTVITTIPYDKNGKIYPGYKNTALHREQLAGIEVIRLWRFSSKRKSYQGKNKLLNRFEFFMFFLSTLRLVPKLHIRPDIVMSSIPYIFEGFLAWYVSKMVRRPFVLEVLDIAKEELKINSFSEKCKILFSGWLQKYLLNKANHIVVSTQGLANKLNEIERISSKISVISNSVDVRHLFPVQKPREWINALELQNRWVVGYLACGKNLEQEENIFLQVAHILATESRIVLLWLSDNLDFINETTSLKKFSNVKILSLTEEKDIKKIWSLIDLCLFIQNDTNHLETLIPTKIYQSMAMQKPILMSARGESAKLIDQADCGWVVEPQDAEAIAQVIRRLSHSPELSKTLGENGQRFVRRFCKRNRIAQQYADLLENVSKNHDQSNCA